MDSRTKKAPEFGVILAFEERVHRAVLTPLRAAASAERSAEKFERNKVLDREQEIEPHDDSRTKEAPEFERKEVLDREQEIEQHDGALDFRGLIIPAMDSRTKKAPEFERKEVLDREQEIEQHDAWPFLRMLSNSSPTSGLNSSDGDVNSDVHWEDYVGKSLPILRMHSNSSPASGLNSSDGDVGSDVHWEEYVGKCELRAGFRSRKEQVEREAYAVQTKRDRWKAVSARYYERHPEVRERKRLQAAERRWASATKALAHRQQDAGKKERMRELNQLGEFPKHPDVNLPLDERAGLDLRHEEMVGLFTSGYTAEAEAGGASSCESVCDGVGVDDVAPVRSSADAVMAESLLALHGQDRRASHG
ncbi:hypothetical protein K438DRAFT_1753896 [Mycena galopus ATCC 62051]|nr:hypothetical protein K438DRAFT_1753896 [Mycena galopus ATCC 62051]